MIYRVVLDDTIDLHTSDINCMLLNPSLDLEMNSAGSFNFTLPPSHPYWDDIKVLKSTIDVYEDGDLIFTGRIASIEKNWNNERVVQCEGALAYFNDSIHRQMKWETPLPIASEDPTVHNFLKDILDNHNVFEGAENANRHIFIGNITVDPEVVTREVNYDTTLDILTRMCIDTNGGYMSVRKDLNDGKLYLDWIKDFTEESGQPAQFGLNLLNFDTSLAAEDICTGVLARGAEVNEQTVMLNNVELVDETTYPDMSVTHYTDKYQDVLWHREGVEKFGQVVQVHDFSDAQTAWKDGQGQIVANSLFEMAKKWLEEKNTKIETIEVEVAELAWLGEGMPKYKLGQIVELIDDVHMAGESYETRLLPMYKLSCDLNSGSKKVTLGTPPKKELTQISASNSDSSTLSSSGSSSGGGGSGEGEECRVHDVKVNGTSVVTDKIANVAVPTDTVTKSQMTQAISTAIAPKANTADVNQALALKQDNLVFNSQDAATAHLTKIKNGNDVYDIPTGTEVEANPTGAATSDLTKLKVGSDIYGIPSGGTEVVANPSEAATDDLNTIKIGETVYDIPGSGGSTNYGKFKCDELFVNTNGALPGTSFALFATLSDSITNYDALFIETSLYYNDNFHQAKPLIIFKQDFNFANSDELQFVQDFSAGSPDYRLFIKLYDETHIYAYRTTSSGGGGSAMTIAKVYGLKFENKLINRSDIYSEEERMIGRWTDGKPLYQKTYDFGSAITINADSWYNTGISSGDIERIIEVSNGQAQTKNTWPLGSAIDSGTIRLLNERNNNITLRWFTIQYTKTTDLPFSKQLIEDPQFVMMSDYYSEDEQVVGRWTDGKPLYQKVVDCGYGPNSSSKEVDLTALNIDNCIQIGGYMCHNTTNFLPIPRVSDRYIADQLAFSYNNSTKLLVITCRDRDMSTMRIMAILKYTKTTDAPGTGPTKGNLIYLPALYSEEEREVGVWTDGKPLYQKTWYFDVTSGTVNIDVTSYEIENVAASNIQVKETKYGTGNLGISSRYDSGADKISYTISGSGILIISTGDEKKGPGHITLQYTKTTDQPGSGTWTPEGQLAHHYSTSEKIVGTWIDGSTVYERTWDFSANPISLPYDVWVNTTISASDNISHIINSTCRNENFLIFEGNEIMVGAANYPVAICAKINHGRTLGYLTLQYTKSS